MQMGDWGGGVCTPHVGGGPGDHGAINLKSQRFIFNGKEVWNY